MTRARSSSVERRIGLDPFVPSAWRPEQVGLDRRVDRGDPPSAFPPALNERRRAENRKRLGLVAELHCAIPSCRATFPAFAYGHRGTEDCFIVVPAHLNGDTAVKVADRFFVVSSRQRQ